MKSSILFKLYNLSSCGEIHWQIYRVEDPACRQNDTVAVDYFMSSSIVWERNDCLFSECVERDQGLQIVPNEVKSDT